MANLAIKGHATRGREVIELLEMLGGVNDGYTGEISDYYYFIDDNYIEIEKHLESDSICFTLEEFLEKFPYKVGDKVVNNDWDDDDIYIISAMYWEDNSVEYSIRDLDGCLHAKAWHANDLQPYKKEMMEDRINEGLENLLEDISYNSKIVFNESLPDKIELVLGDNYEIKVEDGKTYVVGKKPQYPKTYEECEKILLERASIRNNIGCKGELLVAFQRLLVCRDAYWKIAVEQMGLEKPWEPDWKNGLNKCCLTVCENRIVKNSLATANAILVFPTEEMRDAFYENFKELIESCKELL